MADGWFIPREGNNLAPGTPAGGRWVWITLKCTVRTGIHGDTLRAWYGVSCVKLVDGQLLAQSQDPQLQEETTAEKELGEEGKQCGHQGGKAPSIWSDFVLDGGSFARPAHSSAGPGNPTDSGAASSRQ